jgi:hypothetical protein
VDILANAKSCRAGDGDVAERLNRGCFCITLDHAGLSQALDREAGGNGFAKNLATTHPSLFSNTSVFVPARTLAEMERVVRAVEAASRLPEYRSVSLAGASEISRLDFGLAGAFMGYDFHVTPDGPQLIEVNTNAGGAFLNAVAARAHRTCCAQAQFPFETSQADHFEAKTERMFVEEWRRQRGSGRPSTIAIVDDAPTDQFLFPEFVLAKALLERHGIATAIADPNELLWDGTQLTHLGRKIDLVYNRLVDFALDAPEHVALRSAYTSGGAVVTPNPHVHAVLADKRNLTLLSNADLLRQWGLPKDQIDTLSTSVLKTVIVSSANADDLWRNRNALFFKPARGHGSKAAYRGDKITRKVWADITSAEYVAQSYAAPSTRAIERGDAKTELKVDVRLYTYAGEALLAAARLYQGQTTNMRTPGGGFAPVLVIPDEPLAA